MTKDRLIEFVVIGGLLACIAAGPILAYWFDDAHWLWLCAPIILFLS